MAKFCRNVVACGFLAITLVFLTTSHAVLALEGGTFGINLGMMYPDKVSGIEYKSGSLASIGFGLKSGTIRYEMEVKGMTSDIKTPGGDVLIMAALYNVYYDFEGIGLNMVPYLSGGGGPIYVSSSVTKTTVVAAGEDTKTKGKTYSLGFQVKAGVNYLMSETFSWTLGYQYFRTLSIKKLADDNFKAHQVFLGIIWYIG